MIHPHAKSTNFRNRPQVAALQPLAFRPAPWRSNNMSTKLTAEEQAIIMDPNPVWECEPPQREEYTTDEAYANGLIEYARRVIKHRNNKSA